MTNCELLELIANGENSGVEFKRDDISPEQLAKEAVAFANLQGGRILLGVEDDGSISGIERDDLKRWVMDTVFGHYVHPKIVPFYDETRIDERHSIAVIKVNQGTTKPYAVRDHGQENIYIRLGSASRLATQEYREYLHALNGMPRTELLPVSGSGLVDLCQDRLKNYLSSIMGDKDLPADDAAWHKRLCDLGFMTESEGKPPVCTIAGLVLFGYRPRRLLPQAGVRWMTFETKDKTYKATDSRMLDRPLVALRNPSPDGSIEIMEKGLIEKLIETMRPFISEEANEIDPSMSRKGSWLYPIEAIRESIVNAFAHRDWTRCEEVEVALHPDRLEISSPGALQNTMTVKSMIAGRRSPRNTLIADTFRDYGYTEPHGMGVRKKIIPLLQEHNATMPVFEATKDHLKVVMHKGQPRSGIRS
ncbi:MAG: putative DNA binding domain-containing protein [Ectothiorhodospiraceae bacterium AqS1]|nr:putative DNA binding domain-containing protein [Ectothiorhodospiraceae bacterium AqS1]